MKKRYTQLLLLLFLIHLANVSEARTRWYRVNPETVTSQGYAIAWGVRDVPVDFEAIEQSDETIEEFLKRYDHLFVNYLVDVEREMILSEIPSETFFGKIGNYRLGGHYNVSLINLPDVEGLGENQTLLLMEQNWKWDNFYSAALVIEKNERQTRLVKFYDMKDDVRDEINKKLNWPKRQTLFNKALVYQLRKDSANNPSYQLSVAGYIPKCKMSEEEKCESIAIETDIQFRILPDKFEITLTNLKYVKAMN